MRNLDEINLNEGGRPVSRAAPSQQDIQEFENSFGVKLPSDYITLITYANGGHPELNSFIPDNSDFNSRWEVDYFYYLGSGHDLLNLSVVTSEWARILGDGLIPFARDGGGNQIYMDTKNGGRVGLCIHDESYKHISVAESFSSFIDKLEEDPDMI